MGTLPLGIEFDFNSIGIHFNQLLIGCIPDFESLLNEKLSTTFGLFTDNLVIAATASLNALESWLKLLFYLCRLIIHIILLSYPYIKPPIVHSYQYWNSLDLTVQLSIIGFILSIIITYWIKKNHYIQKTNHYVHTKIDKMKHWFGLKWNAIISWISVRSQMTAKIFPHLIWWMILGALIWFFPQHIYASHHALLFIFCFIIPSVKTYSIIRKYTKSMDSTSNSKDVQNKQIQECIEPLKVWLQFWSCRGFVLFTYYLSCYILSYIPGFIINSINDYIVINHALFEIICDWIILWLLVIDSFLSYFAAELTTKIFQLDTSIRSNSSLSSSRREIRTQHTSLADKISLSSINALLSLILRFIRPFVPKFIFNILHDGLYQFLIFFSLIFTSPTLGSYILGYLLPIYTSILALHHLQELQHKISLWNNNQRHELVTPLMTPEPFENHKNGHNELRSRKLKNGNHHNSVLSPDKHHQNGAAHEQAQKSWSLWSLLPSNMFSFVGADEFVKNQRKRQEMHKEANYVLQTIVDRLKYWMVFATMEWAYYFIGEQVGLSYYVPLWNHVKFALILWIQLPYVPYSCCKLYQYVILPFRVLDITHIDHGNVNKKKNDDEVLSDDDVNVVEDGDSDDDGTWIEQSRPLQNGRMTTTKDGDDGARESRSCSMVESKYMDDMDHKNDSKLLQ